MEKKSDLEILVIAIDPNGGAIWSRAFRSERTADAAVEWLHKHDYRASVFYDGDES